MNQQEAYGILGISAGDEPEDIRRKYHRLMHMYHPDAGGGKETHNHEMAQKLNEAFRLLKREGFLAKKNTMRDWGIRENPAAFCARKLYMEEELFGDEIIVDTGAMGRFYWEPDMEPFALLLKSLGEAVNGLIEGAVDERQMRCKAKLLHLLIQEYVQPYECISLLYPLEQTDTEHVKLCRLHCHLKPDGKGNIRAYQEEQMRVLAQGSRLYGYVGQALIGQITFAEDYLYYLVTPLFLQGAAEAVLQVKDIKMARRKNLPYLSAEMSLRIDQSKMRDLTARINAEIAHTLKVYTE